eukprot:s55_g25.t1
MPSPSRSHQTRLKVLIHSASNLPRGDERGLSDPYVVCFLGEGEAAPAFQTQVCRQTLDPVWDEEHMVNPYTPGSDMALQVLDQDDTFKDITERLMSFRGVGSDFLGEVRLASDEFYPHGFEGDLLLEGVPEGRNALLRLRIIVDEEFLAPPTAPQLPVASQHEPGVNDFDTAEFEAMDNLPKEEATPKVRSAKKSEPAKGKLEKTEQRGGSSPSETRRKAVPSAVEVRQVSVTMVGAKVFERCASYCTCEVKGDLRFSSRSHVVNDSMDPVWQKTVAFDYDGIEPMVFCVFRKEVWPKQDSLLGIATLEAEDLSADSLEREMLLEGAEDEATLSVKVTSSHKRRVARQEHPHQRYLEEPAKRLEPLSNATKTAPHPAEMRPRRLKVLIQSFRGLHGLDLATRRCFSCICAVAGHRHADLQTGGAFEAGYQTVWNMEGEIYDYFPGDDLEFHIAAEGSNLEGSATMRCHQFFPFGFNSDLTLSSDGHGIIGLLRVKVTVEKDEIQKPIRGTGHGEAAHLSQQQGDRWLKSLNPSSALQSSLAMAAGSERHRLNESSESAIRRKGPVLGGLPPQVTHVATAPSRPVAPVTASSIPVAASCEPASPQSVLTITPASPIGSPSARVLPSYARPIPSASLPGVLPSTPQFAPARCLGATQLPIPARSQPSQPTQPVTATYASYPAYPTTVVPQATGTQYPVQMGVTTMAPAHLGVQQSFPMVSGMPGDTGTSGVSAGALSLLAEAQASWRAGECGATAF